MTPPAGRAGGRLGLGLAAFLEQRVYRFAPDTVGDFLPAGGGADLDHADLAGSHQAPELNVRQAQQHGRLGQRQELLFDLHGGEHNDHALTVPRNSCCANHLDGVECNSYYGLEGAPIARPFISSGPVRRQRPDQQQETAP